MKIIELIGGVDDATMHSVRIYTHVLFACCIFIIAAAFVDMWSGIDAARTNKQRIDSRGLRRTISKIVDYFRVLVFGTMIDALGLFIAWYNAPYCMILITAGILFIECRSVLENSRKKKSHAADVADVAQKIIECLTKKDAEALIEQIKIKDKEEQQCTSHN